MIAQTQYVLSAADLEAVLAMVRGGTLAAAAQRLQVDTSTVFRSLQRIERGLGQALFERSRSGYLATELAQMLAVQAEQVEAALAAARAALTDPQQVSGTVRITATDAVIQGLVVPAMHGLSAAYPLLRYEISSAAGLVNLTQRDADIAVRATRRPPEHLVGKRIGAIRLALYAARDGQVQRYEDVEAGRAPWIALAGLLPEHPLEAWRRAHFGAAEPAFRADSVLTIQQLVASGAGVALLPTFLAGAHPQLRALTEPLDETANDLWLLTHRDARHLRRISTVFGHLARTLSLA